MRRFGRSAAFVTALALAAVSAAACSSSGSTSSGGGDGSGSFKDVLHDIHAVTQTSDYIEYGATAQVTKLTGTTKPAASGPFSHMQGIGADQLFQYWSLLPPLTGFDSTAVTSAITVGNPPNAVGILYGGFDPAAIGAKLAAWGYKKQDRGGGTTAWISNDDHKIDMTKLDPVTGVGPGMTGWLNVIWVSRTSIAYGGATSDLAAALPAQSKPLSGDNVVSSLADCLGSPLGAMVLTDPKTIGNSAATGVAFGVTATSASDAREEICVAASAAAGAQTIATAFTKAVTTGTDLVQNNPWSKELTDPRTDVLGGSAHVVRLSATSADQQSGLVFRLVEDDDFGTLLGWPFQSTGRPLPSDTSSGQSSD
ncbi:hypothetical protein KGQ20_33105 [Catenulispora sp. NF23]|uniref:Lipoprotein n=1 Tax=Catenulispora pinistramenti TaxID=2705254 RepID=A0ABS5L6Q9_9ACTN|nr:hypothetical protein [Catenulispora pinistramenti]MBS2537601.1 hypothetical protein [Catenulispora pinistramenti]MBS2553915.1 hypothetical protein [Catenulispora pinistramenti]